MEQSSTPIVPCSIGYAATRRSGTVLSLCFSNPVARILWSLPPPLFRSKLMQRPINFQCGANMPSPTPHFFLPGYTISNQFKSYHTIILFDTTCASHRLAAAASPEAVEAWPGDLCSSERFVGATWCILNVARNVWKNEVFGIDKVKRQDMQMVGQHDHS